MERQNPRLKEVQRKTKRNPVLLTLALFTLIAAIFTVPDAGAVQGYRKRVVTVPLTEAEKATLVLMREEEKLARDVYISMYDLWGAVVFSNISVSEQRHMDAILKMLVKYNIPDPAAGNTVGVFKNPDLQSLCDKLISQGRRSLLAAFSVGKTIEETDIRDLLKALDETTKTDLERVYGNLLNASYSHLRAFTSYL